MASYLICYQRCDLNYETVPHIHTPDGIFVVDEQLNALGNKAVIFNDMLSIARVNGELVVLHQTCGNCHTCFVGSQNFHYCPNCRHVLIHIEETPAPFPHNDCPACERGERSLTPPPTSIFPKPVPIHNPSGNVCAKFINPEMLKAVGDFHAKR